MMDPTIYRGDDGTFSIKVYETVYETVYKRHEQPWSPALGRRTMQNHEQEGPAMNNR